MICLDSLNAGVRVGYNPLSNFFSFIFTFAQCKLIIRNMFLLIFTLYILSYLLTYLLKILQYVGVNISENKIEACHLLGKNSNGTIVKFPSREDCEHTMRVKKDLKDLDTNDLDLPAWAKLYISDSLCLFIEDYGMKPRNCGTRKTNFLILLLMVLLG